MHLVELVRQLVAQDFIFIRSKSSDWEYDIAEVRSSRLQLNTIDLVLSRIQNYSDEERRTLEIAATAFSGVFTP